MLCLYCAHPIVGHPCQLPIALHNKSIKFIPGYFCSWNCVKARALEKRYGVFTLISSLAWHTSFKPQNCPGNHNPDCPCLQLHFKIDLPRSRAELEAFGGNMTIEQYRNGFLTVKNIDDWNNAFLVYDSTIIKLKPFPRTQHKPAIAKPRLLQKGKSHHGSILDLINSSTSRR